FQESRIAVVSSTAAATLRQLVMFVVDKMVEEDRRDAVDPKLTTEVTLPDGCTAKLGPYARDAYSVFEDLCLLVNMEKPHFLNLDHCQTAVFPLTLRCTRVVFLLLKQFSFELKTEAEVFLMLLIRMISDDAESAATDHTGSRPAWTRVLAMEIMQGDAELIRNMLDRYDAQQSGSKVFTSLISALKRLVTEKPALLGVSSQMLGVGAPSNMSEGTSGLSYGLDVGGVAVMVANAAATAASATVSGVVGMIGSGAGLSVQSSAMKLQCIDQLDKADSPPIPESYVYLLGVQCIVSLCEGFASFTGPLYTSLMVQRLRTAGEPIIRALPALDLSTLPPDEQTTRHLACLSDELFVDVLTSYQAMASLAGMLALTTPRDAFLTSLAKFAIPSRVVASLESYIKPSTPRSGVSLTENLGLTTPAQPPGLSERNLLGRELVWHFGSASECGLCPHYEGVIATVFWEEAQRFRWIQPPSRSVSGAPVSPEGGRRSQPRKPARHPLLADIDPDNVHLAIQRLFEASKDLEDPAFQDFVNALCKLSSEMVGMQSEWDTLGESESVDEPSSSTVATLSPRNELLHRRRVSGIHLQRTL
ncbi:hypothetical protein BU15DRAFT_69524, partial [Melanogaster broomeanus]